MRIESGSQNASHTPGIYAYPSIRYNPEPVERIGRIEHRNAYAPHRLQPAQAERYARESRESIPITYESSYGATRSRPWEPAVPKGQRINLYA
jgi:hypothetical protein